MKETGRLFVVDACVGIVREAQGPVPYAKAFTFLSKRYFIRA